ncbi:hypothetical protein D3C75_916390 [compost metagenome]
MRPLVGQACRGVKYLQDWPIAEQGFIRAGVEEWSIVFIHMLGQAGHVLGDLIDLRRACTGEEAHEPRQDPWQRARAQGQGAFLIEQPARDLH